MSTPGRREQALGALYAADTSGADGVDDTGLSSRAARLAGAVWAVRRELDEVIAECATGWRVERMPAVDRNVLRIGTYELLHTDTPVGVVIDEAVETAKRFSTTKSGAFVNAVLEQVKQRRAAH